MHGVPVCYGARSKKILRARRTRSGTDLSTVATPKGVREKNLHHRLRTGGFAGPFFPYGLLFVLEHFRVVRVLEDPVRSGDESRVRGKKSWAFETRVGPVTAVRRVTFGQKPHAAVT